MGKSYFEFRHFTVRQQRCAMKVGTDGTLLGAWAAMPSGGVSLLDIGTGTGLIALMMAQRFPACSVTALDIAPDAVGQAAENVGASPFSDRITVMEADVASYQAPRPFDAIVSNPPYFEHSLECPDSQRTTARHTSALSYQALIGAAHRLLADDGLFSLIIPDDCRERLMGEACLQGFFPARICGVRTTPSKPPKRYLIELRKRPVEQVDMSEEVLEILPGRRSPWYHGLTSDFYIR